MGGMGDDVVEVGDGSDAVTWCGSGAGAECWGSRLTVAGGGMTAGVGIGS